LRRSPCNEYNRLHGIELEAGHRQHERARPRGLLGCGPAVRGGRPSTLIKQLLAAGRIGAEAVVEHRGRKSFRGYAAIRHPEDSFDQTSGVGRGRRLLFQDVPEGKSGKNRLHIDVHSEPGGIDKLVARLEELGATRVREVDKEPAGHWWIMQDPEGYEFCAATA
jgi:Glyoxalase-like domain